MAVDATLPEITTIIVTALVDSINPCAIGVMLLLVGLLASNKEMKDRLLYYGGLYIFAVFITYLIAGLGLLYFFTLIPLWVAQYISIFVGAIVIFGGITEIKDFFWYGKGFSLAIPANRAQDIKKMMQNINPINLILLGAFVAAVELPCTGGPYLAIILVLKYRFDFWAMLLLILYNIIFVLPLIAILGATMLGAKLTDMQKWKDENKALMRLGLGLLLVALGWLLILIANGTINLG